MKTTISVYFKTGQVFQYDVLDSFKAREHMSKIWEHGYRSADESGTELVWYGPHWIDKIKCSPAPSTNYPDLKSGT